MATKKSLILTIFFFMLLCSVLKVGGSYALGRILIDVFSQGTQCRVTLTDPELIFFPLSGRVKNVHFQHPEETAPSVESKEISIRVNVGELFHKRVLLEDLFLRNTRVDSQGPDSAFIRLMTFVLKRHPPKEAVASWHSLITSGWKFRLQNVDITTPANSQEGLKLGLGNSHFTWDEVHFSSFDPSSEEPTAMRAVGTNFRIHKGNSPELLFGRTFLETDILHGVLRVQKAIVDSGNDLTAQQNESIATADGTIFLRDENRYDITVSADSTADYLAQIWPPFAATAAAHPFSLSIHGKVTGALTDPLCDANIDLAFAKPLRIATKSVHDINETHFHVQVSPEKLDVDNLNVPSFLENSNFSLLFADTLPVHAFAELPEFSVTGSGTLNPLTISSQVRAKYVSPQAAGPIAISVTQHGEVINVSVEDRITVERRQTTMSNRPRELSVLLDYDRSREEVVNLTANAVGYPLVRATSWLLPFLSERSAITVAKAVQDESALDATIRLQQAQGGLQGDGFIALSTISPFGVLIDKLSLAPQVKGKTYSLRDIQIASFAGPISGSGAIASGGSYSVDLTSDPFNLELHVHGEVEKELKLAASASSLPLSLFGFEALGVQRHHGKSSSANAGALSFTAEYNGPATDLLSGKGFVRVSNITLADGANIVETQHPLYAEIENGRATFRDVQFRSEDKSLSVTGFVDNESGWQAGLQGRWELSQMIFRRLPLEQLTGLLEGSLSLTGPVANPELKGTVDLNDGSISFPLGGTVVGANDIHAHATVNKNAAVIEKISANIGDGTATGSGSFDNLLPFSKASGRVDFSLQDIVVEPIARMVIQGDGVAAIAKVPDSPLTISGDIAISSANYEDTVDLKQLIKLVTEKLSGAVSTETASRFALGGSNAGNTVYDVHLHAPNGIIIETNIAQAELAGDLRFVGSGSDIGPEGNLQSIEGSFTVGSNKFEITSGKLQFPQHSEGREPQIDLVGEATVSGIGNDEHRIRLAVNGGVSNPQITFSSDTGLREQQIVSLLGIGASLGKVSLLGSTGERKSVAQLVNPVSGVRATERVTGLAEFSDVRVDSYTSPLTGEVIPRIVARRPLIGDLDLKLSSELAGEQVGAAGVEYPLTKTLDFTAGWATKSETRDTKSNSGSISAGVRYRKTFPGLTLVPQWYSETREAETR